MAIHVHLPDSASAYDALPCHVVAPDYGIKVAQHDGLVVFGNLA